LDELVEGDPQRDRGSRATLRYALTCLAASVGLVYGVLGVPGTAWASTWAVHLQASSQGQSRAQAAPSAPTGVTATCTSSSLTTIKVTWAAVTHATTYTVYKSTTSSSSGYSVTTTGVVGTSWTSGSLANASYWFEMVAVVGTNWTGAQSSATAQRIITTSHCA
jgi:hypothetical protein